MMESIVDLHNLKSDYQNNGYISAVDILTREEAAHHRAAMENAEQSIGKLHYKPKVHTILQSPLELATLPTVLDIIEALIGENILLYNVTYVNKEPHTEAKVSWHQDLTYWGLSHDDQVSMWLALSPATRQSGCMRMIPGSHLTGRQHHTLTDDDTNVLYQGQTVDGVDETSAVMCTLQPGQASFHHGWTLHASTPNQSDDRRIGLNVQYIATHVRQLKHNLDSAILVRGKDKYQYYETDQPATSDLDPTAIARQVELENRYREITGQA